MVFCFIPFPFDVMVCFLASWRRWVQSSALFSIFSSFETDICLKSLNTLERAGLIKMDDGFDLKPTGGFLIFKLE